MAGIGSLLLLHFSMYYGPLHALPGASFVSTSTTFADVYTVAWWVQHSYFVGGLCECAA